MLELLSNLNTEGTGIRSDLAVADESGRKVNSMSASNAS